MGPVAADSETVAVSAEMVVVRTLFGSRILIPRWCGVYLLLAQYHLIECLS
jgi:hypothetical protein